LIHGEYLEGVLEQNKPKEEPESLGWLNTKRKQRLTRKKVYEREMKPERRCCKRGGMRGNSRKQEYKICEEREGKIHSTEKTRKKGGRKIW